MTTEPSARADELAHAVIGAAIEVHRLLGPGYLEKIYEEALSIELGFRGIPFQRQHPVAVLFKGHVCGEGKLDFLVGQELVVELKAVDLVGPIYKAQVISYLKVTGLKLGLLINFKSVLAKSGISRVVLTDE